MGINPYVGEPHAMLSQVLFNRGAYAEAAHHAIIAIDLLQQWVTSFDKRNSFAQWLGFSRMMLLRAKRREHGLSVFPHQVLSIPSAMEPEGATYLQDVIAGIEGYTEQKDAKAINDQEAKITASKESFAFIAQPASSKL